MFLLLFLLSSKVVGQQSLKLAMTADMATGRHAQAVLEVVRDEGCDALIVNGDLAYSDGPTAWFNLVDDVLGRYFPVFAAVGDEEDENGDDWYDDFSPHFRNRGFSDFCEGEVGINSVCELAGLVTVVLTAHGNRMHGGNNANYIESVLSQARTPWRICVFHFPEMYFQTGGREPHAGYDVYEVCRKYGAFITTANTHNYARSYPMAHYERQIIDSFSGDHVDNPIIIQEDVSFVLANGCGGAEMHGAAHERRDDPWWAMTGDQATLKHGPVICTFEGLKMECEYVDEERNVKDRFFAESRFVNTSSVRSSPSSSTETSQISASVKNLACGPIESGRIAGERLTQLQVADHDDCCSKCLEHASDGCVAWAFNIDEAFDDRKGTCILRSSIDVLQEHSDYISGFLDDRSSSDCNYEYGRLSGSAITHFDPEQIRSIDECCDECSKYTDCIGWTFRSVSQECVLRKTFDLMQNNDEWVSGWS